MQIILLTCGFSRKFLVLIFRIDEKGWSEEEEKKGEQLRSFFFFIVGKYMYNKIYYFNHF